MNARLAWFMAFSVYATACSSAVEEVEDDDASEDAIVGGERTASKHPAVGYLVQPSGERHCTGTLIAPDVVLTAAHCYSGPSELHFGVGEFKRGNKVYRAKPSGNALTPYAFTHPRFDGNSHDIAYVVLEEPVRSVAPARIADYRNVGACDVEAVGYGRSVEGPNESKQGFSDLRKLATICIEGLDRTTGFLNAKGINGSTCVGDSGGGLMVRGGEADSIVAVVRGGDRCETGAPIRFQPLAGEEAFVRQALAASRK